jgi:hypothetical protein
MPHFHQWLAAWLAEFRRIHLAWSLDDADPTVDYPRPTFSTTERPLL